MYVYVSTRSREKINFNLSLSLLILISVKDEKNIFITKYQRNMYIAPTTFHSQNTHKTASDF